ncbi:MAG: DUF3881 family protein [Lachnospiraceae bacterium]|nr:DUF3881 family protein [Lachnospiraceae bacterium]
MHKYLRAVGFSNITSKKELQKLVKKAVRTASRKSYTSLDATMDNDCLYAEYQAEFGERIGICVRGEYDENNVFSYDYCFPFLRGDKVSSIEDLSVERHIEKISFAGIVDDLKVGISVIFYLQNIITYLKLVNANRLPIHGTSLTLSALSDNGKILLPIRKNKRDIQRIQNYNYNKSQMLAAAKNGDEEAIENLTMEDIDTYSLLQKKIHNEDVLSLVDTYFMPYGVECDLYSILGEIISCETVVNTMTGETIYIMGLDVNDLVFDVCINQQDLMGEPAIGRRFKGTVWLQGYINYPEELN